MDEEMKAGEFKSKCLHVMDMVKKTRRKITITKRNVPVARIVPIEESSKELFGKLKGTIIFKEDILEPIDEEWDANT